VSAARGGGGSGRDAQDGLIRAKRRQCLCRAKFQYRIVGDVVRDNREIGCPNAVGPLPAGDTGGSLSLGWAQAKPSAVR